MKLGFLDKIYFPWKKILTSINPITTLNLASADSYANFFNFCQGTLLG